MQVYDDKAFDWNRRVGPEGNLAGTHPDLVAEHCNTNNIPWYTTSWPYSAGLLAYCIDAEVWWTIIEKSK